MDNALLCEKVAERPLGELGIHLGVGMDMHFPGAGLTTPLRIAHFVAQTAHETEGFRYLVELGDEAYFSRYDGRRDLGNTQPGDGFRFRGRGIIQITGRANYATYGQITGLDLLGDPDLAADPVNAVWIACLYWASHNLNNLADRDDVISITKRINGGLTGLADREAMLRRAKTALGI